MPSDLTIPDSLDHQLRSLYQRARSFPDWDQYVAERNGVLDPLTWLSKKDARVYNDIFNQFIESAKIPFVRLLSHTCFSNAVHLYLENELFHSLNQGMSRQKAHDAILESTGPIPFTTIGHLVTFVHCDPSTAAPVNFPRELCSPLWASLDDYLRLREAFLESARSLLPAISPRQHVFTPMPEGLAFDRIHSRWPDIRRLLKWAEGISTVGARDKALFAAMLSLDRTDVDPDEISDEMRSAFIAAESNFPIVIPAAYIQTDPRALGLMSNRSVCNKHMFAPYAFSNGYVFIAAENPFSPPMLNEISKAFSGRRPIINLATQEGIRHLITDHARTAQDNRTALSSDGDDLSGAKFRLDPAEYSTTNPRLLSGDIDRLARFLLCEGTTERASDIHIDVFNNATRVRYRIDGELRVFHSLPVSFAERLCIWLKDNGAKRTNTSERPAVPLEGSFTFAYLGKRVMCRIAVGYNDTNKALPKIVLRIQDPTTSIKDLASMGLFADESNLFREALSQPYGVIIISGGTGQGKSTTQAAAIQEINDASRSIYTMEDPIEYQIPGVAQFAVASVDTEKSPERLMFNESLRLQLRMNPEVIAVGEIRDHENANTTIDASNTGHLIIATLHSNTAVDGIKRLLSETMHVDRSNLGPNLLLLTSQRLVKRFCNCYEKIPITEEAKQLFQEYGIEHGEWMGSPKGCKRCRDTGYHGRIAIIEFLKVTSEIADLITEGASDKTLRMAVNRAASEGNYIPFYKAALRRVATEQTSLEIINKAIVREHRLNRSSKPVEPDSQVQVLTITDEDATKMTPKPHTPSEEPKTEPSIAA